MRFVYFSIVLIFAASVFCTAPIMIPMTDKTTYDFLDYLNTSGVIEIPFTGAKPYRSDEIYELLKGIEQTDRRTESFIRRFEEMYLDKDNRFGVAESENVTGWFDAYWNQSYLSQKASERPHFNYYVLNQYHYLAKDRAAGYNPAYYEYGDVSQHITDGGLKMYMGYRDFLSLYTESGVMLRHSYDTRLRDEFRTLVLVPSGGEADFSSEDYTMTSLALTGSDIYFSLGKYPLSLGSGMINSLTLSNIDAYYENFMFSVGAGRFKFTTVTGFLLADSQTRFEAGKPDYAITNETESRGWKYYKREKYLSAHRLEWRALNNLSFGVNEMVVSGDRTIELGYLIPVMPLFWIEHYYGDHDNVLVSFDVSYRPFRNLTLYGEVNIDDETFTESWTRNYMNKWAVAGGFHNTKFLGVDGLSFNFEYARVEPYVYGHKFHINRYMNLDYFLSVPGGPDSETLNYRLKYFFDFDKHLTLGYTRQNRGEPIWGKWDAPDYNNDIKTFLRGTVEKKNNFYASAGFRFSKYISAEFFYSHTNINNYNHNLPSYDDKWRERYQEGYYVDELDEDGDVVQVHVDYSGYQDYYEREVRPAKVQQNYINNTFSLTVNFMFKNYFSNIFGGK